VKALNTGRMGKQARERWYNHLDPTLKGSAPWSEEEDIMLFESQKKLGNRWCEIAKIIVGRSENDVKNRWNSHKRKEKKRLQAEQPNADQELVQSSSKSSLLSGVSLTDPNLIGTNVSSTLQININEPKKRKNKSQKRKIDDIDANDDNAVASSQESRGEPEEEPTPNPKPKLKQRKITTTATDSTSISSRSTRSKKVFQESSSISTFNSLVNNNRNVLVNVDGMFDNINCKTPVAVAVAKPIFHSRTASLISAESGQPAIISPDFFGVNDMDPASNVLFTVPLAVTPVPFQGGSLTEMMRLKSNFDLLGNSEFNDYLINAYANDAPHFDSMFENQLNTHAIEKSLIDPLDELLDIMDF
jgi:hypothetical protein